MSHSSPVILLRGRRATVCEADYSGLGQGRVLTSPTLNPTLESQASHQEMMVRRGCLEADWRKKPCANQSLPTKT